MCYLLIYANKVTQIDHINNLSFKHFLMIDRRQSSTNKFPTEVFNDLSHGMGLSGTLMVVGSGNIKTAQCLSHARQTNRLSEKN